MKGFFNSKIYNRRQSKGGMKEKNWGEIFVNIKSCIVRL